MIEQRGALVTADGDGLLNPLAMVCDELTVHHWVWLTRARAMNGTGQLCARQSGRGRLRMGQSRIRAQVASRPFEGDTSDITDAIKVIQLTILTIYRCI